jgi:hypothetical protein
MWYMHDHERKVPEIYLFKEEACVNTLYISASVTNLDGSNLNPLFNVMHN